jgi:hypothetical protein
MGHGSRYSVTGCRAPAGRSISLARRVLLATVIAIGTALAAMLLHVPAVHAAPPPPDAVGRACVILAPRAANGAGHVGWAFRAGSQQWYYGATQGKALPWLPRGHNRAWIDSGSFSRVLADFGGAKRIDGKRYHDAGYYQRYRCADVHRPNPKAALEVAEDIRGRGYSVFGCNCMDHAHEILTAYGARLPSPKKVRNYRPNDWFANLGDTGFEAPHSLLEYGLKGGVR